MDKNHFLAVWDRHKDRLKNKWLSLAVVCAIGGVGQFITRTVMGTQPVVFGPVLDLLLFVFYAALFVPMIFAILGFIDAAFRVGQNVFFPNLRFNVWVVMMAMTVACLTAMLFSLADENTLLREKIGMYEGTNKPIMTYNPETGELEPY